MTDINEILERLEDDRVLKVSREGDVVYFDEECDRWYRSELTLEETIMFGQYLIDLAKGEK